MCGIAGILDYSSRLSADDLKSKVVSMTSAIEHRGPDDSGAWLAPSLPLALGHRRLSILDLSSAGHQPMLSHCGRYVFVFNGEIYNFNEIKKSIDSTSSVTWRGHSDTEIVLEAFARHGIRETLQKLNGMFAFALWDQEREELHLCRDRAGKKPLFYGWQDKRFLFGSELKAIKAGLESSCEVDRNALAMLMRMNFIPSPYSILKGVHKLPPASLLTLNLNQLTHRQAVCPFPRREYSVGMPWLFWDSKQLLIDGSQHPASSDQESVLDELDHLMRDAVQKRMIADVPIGGFLSGGIDSALTVSMMQSLSSKPIKTFTIGFNEPGNEAHHAKAISQHLGTDHTELYLEPNQVLDEISRLPSISDEPHGDTAIIPTYLVSRLAREKVTVVLSGDGGDELFAGYPRYIYAHERWVRAHRQVGWIPELPRKAFLRIIRDMPKNIMQGIPLGKHFIELERLLRFKTPEDLYHDSIDQWRDPTRLVLGSEAVGTLMTEQSHWPIDMDPIQRMVYLDLAGRMPDSIVSKVDRASMAVSIEARCPILDYRVIEYAATIPTTMKIQQGYGKWILRQLLHRYVPQSLVDRPKAGFKLPLCEWIRGPLRAWADELLEPELLADQGYFDVNIVSDAYQNHLSGKQERHYHLWNILMFQSWLKSWKSDGVL